MRSEFWQDRTALLTLAFRGLLNTFGVYQAYYETGQLFTSTTSNISWIGSIQAFLMLLVGTVTGPIFDGGHLRILLIIGTFGVVFGHMMLSLVHEYWQALLAQAFVIGLGAGCLYVPSVAVNPQWFSSRLITAMGISVAGSSLGGIIYPIMFNNLVKEIGFPWAVRTIGFFALALLMIPITTMRIRAKPPGKRALFDPTTFTDPSFLAFMLSGFFGYIGLLIPFFYITFTSTARNFASGYLSFYLLPILNAASVFGRIIPAMLADRVGPLNTLIPTAAVTSLLAYCLIAVDNFAGIVVMAVFYGFWSGAYISLPPAIFVKLTPPDKRHLIGTRMGVGFCMMGLGILVGTPIAGAISGPTNDFTGVYIFSGSTLAVACVGFIITRFIRVGAQVMVKV